MFCHSIEAKLPSPIVMIDVKNEALKTLTHNFKMKDVSLWL